MSLQDADPSPARHRGYRPGIVVIVITTTVLVGVLLKAATRDYRAATSAPQQIVGEDVNPAAAK